MVNRDHAQNLNLTARQVLSAHVSYMPVMVGIRLFVTTFVLSVAGDFAAIGIFRFAMFIALALVFVVIAPLCKRSGHIHFYRAGFALSLIFFLALALLGERTGQYLISTGILLGIAAGLYWLPYHLFKMALSRRQCRLTYFSFENTAFQIVSVIFPVLLGWLIYEMKSYVGFFVLCTVLLMAGFLLSRSFKMMPLPQAASYSLRAFAGRVMGDAGLRNIYRATFFMGAGLYGALDILIPAVIFAATGSELKLGVISSILPVLSAAISLLMKNVPASRYSRTGIFSAIVMMMGSLLLVQEVTFFSCVAFAVIYAICYQPISILHNLYLHNVIDRNQELACYAAEHFVFFESVLELGRLLGFALFFFLPGMELNGAALKVIFVLLSLTPLAAMCFLSRSRID